MPATPPQAEALVAELGPGRRGPGPPHASRARPGSRWPSGSWSSTRRSGVVIYSNYQSPELNARAAAIGVPFLAKGNLRALRAAVVARHERAVAELDALLGGRRGRRPRALLAARDPAGGEGGRRGRGRAGRPPGRGPGPAPDRGDARRRRSTRPRPASRREPGRWASTTPTARPPAPAARARDTAQPALDDTGGGVIVMARYDPPGPATSRLAGRASSATPSTPLGLSPTLDSLEQDRGSLGCSDRSAGSWVPRTARSDAADDERGHASGSPLDQTVAPGWRLEALVPPSPASPAAVAGRRSSSCSAGLAVAWVIVRGIRRAEAERAESRRRRRSEAHGWPSSPRSPRPASTWPRCCRRASRSSSPPWTSTASRSSAPMRRPTFVWRDAPGGRRAGAPAGGPGPRRLLRRRTARPRRAVAGSAAGASASRAGRAGPAHADRVPPRRCPPRSPTPTPTRSSAP